MRRRCDNCFFGHLCNEPGGCSHYAPMNEERIDTIINRNRREHDSDWIDYIYHRDEEINPDLLLNYINIIK